MPTTGTGKWSNNEYAISGQLWSQSFSRFHSKSTHVSKYAVNNSNTIDIDNVIDYFNTKHIHLTYNGQYITVTVHSINNNPTIAIDCINIYPFPTTLLWSIVLINCGHSSSLTSLNGIFCKWTERTTLAFTTLNVWPFSYLTQVFLTLLIGHLWTFTFITSFERTIKRIYAKWRNISSGRAQII